MAQCISCGQELVHDDFLNVWVCPSRACEGIDQEYSADKWQVVYTGSNSNGDGRIYPDTAEVRIISGRFEVWDVTGWNGYDTCGDTWCATFSSELDAIEYVNLHYEIWSDTRKVLRAAIDLLDKNAGSFAQLKAAVDWRDRQ